MNLEQHIIGVQKTELSGRVLCDPIIALFRWAKSIEDEDSGELHAAESKIARVQRDAALYEDMEKITWSLHSVLTGRQSLQCIHPLTSDEDLHDKIGCAVEAAIEKYLKITPEAIEDLFADASAVNIDIDQMDKDEDSRLYIVSWYLNGKIYNSGIVDRMAKLLRLEPGHSRIATSPPKDRT